MAQIERFLAKGCDWRTPWEVARDVRNLFGGCIELDPCTDARNLLHARRFYTPAEDGLVQPWVDETYCNPPFGEQVKDWMRKAELEARFNLKIALMLSVSRTETPYFQDYILDSQHLTSILFFKGKLKFNDGKDTGMLASWMFFFNIEPTQVIANMGHHGKVLVVS